MGREFSGSSWFEKLIGVLMWLRSYMFWKYSTCGFIVMYFAQFGGDTRLPKSYYYAAQDPP
jgi:hypothetical protein